MTETTNLLKNLEEIAAFLKLGRNGAVKLTQKPDFPGFKAGKSWRVDKNELEAWFKNMGKAEEANRRRHPELRRHKG